MKTFDKKFQELEVFLEDLECNSPDKATAKTFWNAALKEAIWICMKHGGYPPSVPISCCEEDYENHYISVDIIKALEQELV